MKPPRTLIIVTLFVLIGIGVLLSYLNKNILPLPVSIQTSGNPTIGSSAAEVDIVLFTDPKCESCKEFHDLILPALQTKYIHTEKARLTVIPVSVVSGSTLGSNALLCVYHQAPLYPNTDLFFKYLTTLCQHQDETWTNETLLAMAMKTDVTINLPKLKACTEMEKWNAVIMKNTEYGKELTGNHLKVPSLFVNGVRLKEVTEHDLFSLIEYTLSQKEPKS